MKKFLSSTSIPSEIFDENYKQKKINDREKFLSDDENIPGGKNKIEEGEMLDENEIILSNKITKKKINYLSEDSD